MYLRPTERAIGPIILINCSSDLYLQAERELSSMAPLEVYSTVMPFFEGIPEVIFDELLPDDEDVDVFVLLTALPFSST